MRATDVALLDDVLGGLAPGFPLVLAGPTGGGRTVLCLQLAHAACLRGERVAFLTGEPARLLLRQAESMELDLAPALRDERLVLLELDADVASTARAHGGRALIEAIGQSVPDAGLVLIDPLTSLTAEVIDEVTLRALVRTIFDSAAESDQVVVVSVEDERLEQDAALERVLKEACGALVELSLREEGERQLQVSKARIGGLEPGPVRFTIGAGGAIRVPEAGAPAPVQGEGMSRDPAVASPLAALKRARFQVEPATGEPAAEARTAPERPERQTAFTAASTKTSAPLATVAEAPSAPEAAGSAATRRRILVVEDDALMRAQLVDWLADRYDVATAEDGFTAMTAVLAQRPELLILDLILPRVSGFEVLRALRGTGSQVPVLVVSGSLSRAVDRVRALVLGASDTMPKPVQRFELTRKVASLLAAPIAASELATGLDAENVEALLSGATAMRVLEEGPFRERLERACRFGEEFGLPSALVAIETPSAAALEALMEAAGRTLRAEDALCAIGERRALLLLVATELAMVPRIVSRFEISRPRRGSRSSQALTGYRFASADAEPAQSDKPWDALFEELTDWPEPAAPKR